MLTRVWVMSELRFAVGGLLFLLFSLYTEKNRAKHRVGRFRTPTKDSGWAAAPWPNL
jgi:hypothetical protein